MMNSVFKMINFPDYLLQVPSRQQLINLLDMAIYIRNISMFILVSKNVEFCIQNVEFRIQNEDFGIENDDFVF